jgi:hypothetical protein
MRELNVEELEMVSGAGVIVWLIVAGMIKGALFDPAYSVE